MFMNHHHGPGRGQVVVDERGISRGQPAPFDTEVAHPLGHQGVLLLIINHRDLSMWSMTIWREPSALIVTVRSHRQSNAPQLGNDPSTVPTRGSPPEIAHYPSSGTVLVLRSHRPHRPSAARLLRRKTRGGARPAEGSARLGDGTKDWGSFACWSVRPRSDDAAEQSHILRPR